MSPILLAYVYLGIAIVTEVIGTTLLKSTASFTRPLPTLGVAISYAATFYFMSLTLKVMPVGVTYAIWSGVGIVLIAVLGWLFYRQSLDPPALVGLALIVAGVVVINLFSKTIAHD